ncbi:MAG: hypothetical protein DRQ41_05870 [Gammaproteobacteria bacterium]|nr:MAG: hypothetical protein DRQ41_05870 [Gammaproteobacteria bacterium]
MIGLSVLAACAPIKPGGQRDPGGLTDESVPYTPVKPGQSSSSTSTSVLGSQILSSYSGSYALLIGESQYTHGWSKLGSIPGELQEVEKVLVSQGFNKVEKSLNAPVSSLKVGQKYKNVAFDNK